MAYAIDGEFKKQNLITMNLSKKFPLKPYRFWSVLSIYMQALNSSDQQLASTTLLPLAKRMVEKFEADDQFRSASEVELYLLILEKLNDYKKAIEIIDGKLGKLLSNSIGFVDKQKADYLLKLKKYDQAFDIYVSLIEKNTDLINYYLQLIEIIKLNDNLNEKNKFVIKLFDLFEQLKPECDFKVRGYYLARIELIKQVEQLNDQSYAKKEVMSNMPSIDSLLVEYFEVFGIKQAFIYDFFYLIKKYEFKPELIEKVVNEIGQQVQTINKTENEDSLIKHSNYQALLQTTGCLSIKSKEDKIKNLKNLVEYYNESFNLKNMFTKTEFNHGDFYLQIAVYYLNQLDAEEDDDLILSLIALLEKALRKCTANYTLKVFLIHLYNLVGATSCSYQTFEKLDIKYILYDSLSYLVFNELYLFGNYFTYSNLLNSSEKFYQNNSKETLDYLALSYKHGNFSKVIEILNLEKRLNFSLQNFQIQLEKIYFDLVSTTKNYDQLFTWISTVNLENLERKLNENILIDNRDYSIYRTYDSKINEILKANQKSTYNQTLDWSRLRVAVLKVIWSVERIVSKRSYDNKNNSIEEQLNEFEQSVKSLKDNLKTKNENGNDALNNHLNNLSLDDHLILCKSNLSRLKIFLNYSNNYEPILKKIEFIRLIFNNSESNGQASNKPTILSELHDYFNDKIENFKQSNFTRFKQIVKYLLDLNCFNDLFSIFLVLVTLTHKQIKKTNNKTYATVFNQFLVKLENLTNKLITQLKSMDMNLILNKNLSNEIDDIVYSNDVQQVNIYLKKKF